MPSDFLVTLRPIVRQFNQLGIAYYVGGSLASSTFGRPRTTVDIDLIADFQSEQAAPFVQALSGDYYVDENMIQEAIDAKSAFNLIHQETMLKVDVFLLKGRAYDRTALRRGRSRALQEGETDEEFMVASPEDVVLSKLEWFMKGGEVSERQWSDVIGVLQVQRERLSREYLLQWAEALGLTRLLQKALGEAEI